MKRKQFNILILLLVIGFASVSTTLILNGRVGIGVELDNFNVIFVEALLDGNKSDKAIISSDKKTITFSTDKFINKGDSARLDYKVKNTSTQYDADVTINCTNESNEYVTVESSFDGNAMPLDNSVNMKAQEVKSGYINTELTKAYPGDDTSIEIVCSIVFTATSREEIVEDEEYIVSLNTGYEESVQDIKVKYYEEYSKLPELTRENYKFLGWYTEDDIKVDNNSLAIIKGNHTLHAKWLFVCPYEVGQTWTFDYTGSEQEFSVPCDGNYKLETWGAQGGTYNTTYYGGYGAYAKGDVNLKYNSKIFINVGSTGSIARNYFANTGVSGGYNGGGTGAGSWKEIASNYTIQYNISGGGATHIATASGLLMNLKTSRDKIIIVSSGGGGSQYFYYESGTNHSYCIGGHGGGITGTLAQCDTGFSQYLKIVSYATQTTPASVIWNGSSTVSSDFGVGMHGYSGGGGGYYGGIGVYVTTSGGSSYIGNPLLTNKSMYCYNCTESSEESTKTISTTCTSATPTANCAKQGNGYAKITYLGN